MRALTRFARQLRKEAEHLWAVAGDEVRFAPLVHGSCPSTGTCRATVTWMRGRFVSRGVDPDNLVLINAAGAGACKKHSWLRLRDPDGDIDVDITADQFTDDSGQPLPSVIVVPAGEGPCGRGRAKAWPRTPGKHVQAMVVAGGLGGLAAPAHVRTVVYSDEPNNFTVVAYEAGTDPPYDPWPRRSYLDNQGVDGFIRVMRTGTAGGSFDRTGGFVDIIMVSAQQKRRGVGTLLWEVAAAESCSRFKAGLISGTTRSPPAERFWRKQEKKGRAVCLGESGSKKRPCLQYQLPCPAPASLAAAPAALGAAPRVTIDTNDAAALLGLPVIFTAKLGRKKVGQLQLDRRDGHVADVEVIRAVQRQGIATVLYEAAASYMCRHSGTPLRSGNVNELSAEFWRKQARKRRAKCISKVGGRCHQWELSCPPPASLAKGRRR